MHTKKVRAELKRKAIELRRNGKSYSEINEIVPVSQSTLSLWLRSVELSRHQRLALVQRRLQAAQISGSLANHQKRVDSSYKTINTAWEQSKKLLRDPFFVLGLGLYWAEGTKRSEHFRFTNSDPIMIRTFMKWIRTFCDVPEEMLRAQLHIHTLHCRTDAESYWAELTGIPVRRFVKTYVKETSLGHRKNILYNGTFVIRIGSVELFRRMVGWRLGMLEAFGIIRPSVQEREKMISDIIDNAKNMPL